MQAMLRGLGLTLLLMGIGRSGFGDGSVRHGRNQLSGGLRCQFQNCMASGASAHKPCSSAKTLLRETGPSLSLRRTAKFSHVGQGSA